MQAFAGMLWTLFWNKVKSSAPIFAYLGLLICAAISSQLAFAQTDTNDAIQRALRQHQGESTDDATLPRSTNQVIQPAILPVNKPAPPSALELLYQSRAHRKLSQYGYDILGVPTAVTLTQSGAVQENYILGEGDEIVFQLRGQENATYRQRINRDGQVVLPKLSPIRAAGRTFADFRRDVEARVAQAFISTNVFLSLGEARQVSVLVSGEVRSPGTRILSGFSSPLDAILLSGGIAKTGSLRRVQLFRGGRAYTIDLYSVLSNARGAQIGFLRDGDRIYVPVLGATVGVAGTIGRPGIYELPANASAIGVRALIQLAGGFQIAGAYNLTKTQLERNGDSELVAVTAAASVRSGEILFVDSAPNATLGRIVLRGAVRFGGERIMALTGTVGQLIPTARDLNDNAYTAAAIIVRHDEVTNAISIIPFSLVATLAKRTNVNLQSNDVVYVFSRDETRALVTLAIQDPALLATTVGNVSSPPQAVSAPYRSTDETSPDVRPGIPSRAPQDVRPGIGAPQDVRPGISGAQPLPLSGSAMDANDARLAALASAALLARQQREEAVRAGALNLAPADDSRKSDEEIVDGIAKSLGVTTMELVRTASDNVAWVLDEVRAPGPYFVGAGTSISEVIGAAGGVLDQADLSAIEVTTTTLDRLSGISRTERQAYLENETSSIYIHSRDIVRLRAIATNRQRGNVTVAGEVRYPGVFDILRDERLSSVLQRAGGLSESAYPYGAVFTRVSAARTEKEGNEREAREIESDAATLSVTANERTQASVSSNLSFLMGIAASLRTVPTLGRVMITADPTVLAVKPELDLLLEPGDSLFVPKRPSSVTVSGEVLNPGSFQYRGGLSLQDYLKFAGGAKDSADEGRTFIVLPDGSASTFESNWLSFEHKAIPPGSTIVVPRDLHPFDWTTFLKDLTQITSQLAVTAASLSVLRSN